MSTGEPQAGGGTGWRSACSLLTVIGGASAPHRWAPAYFGAVGLVLGAVLGGAWWALGSVAPPLVAAALIVALDAGLTGMLHLDGLADCADGLLAPMDRERRLTVMRTPDVGAFAVVVVGLCIVLQVVALAALSPSPLLLAGLWALARGAMSATTVILPYARPSGLATAFGERRANVIGAVSGAGGGAVVLVLAGSSGLGALLGGLLGAFGVMTLARRRLGGYTGDVLGALVVVAQTVGLVAATVHRP